MHALLAVSAEPIPPICISCTVTVLLGEHVRLIHSPILILERTVMFFLRKKLTEIYRKLYYERPSEKYRRNLLTNLPALCDDACENFPEQAQHLCEEGYLILPQYFKGKTLADLKEDFERSANGKDWDRFNSIHIERDELINSISASREAVNPYLTGLVEYYWGKKIYLSEFSGLRHGSEISPDIQYKQWHHDAKRKQVKIFILLTEVKREGQPTSFLPKTHKIWHKIDNYEDSRFDESRMKPLFEKYGEAVYCTGPPGTVFIFDTNMLHSPNRGGAVRDAWIFSYTAGRSLLPVSGPHPEALKGFSKKQKQIFRALNY